MENMETLSWQRMTKKTNETLESAIRDDPYFITDYNISFLLKESSVRRRVEDLDFKHSDAKKFCMTTAHEKTDE